MRMTERYNYASHYTRFNLVSRINYCWFKQMSGDSIDLWILCSYSTELARMRLLALCHHQICASCWRTIRKNVLKLGVVVYNNAIVMVALDLWRLYRKFSSNLPLMNEEMQTELCRWTDLWGDQYQRHTLE